MWYTKDVEENKVIIHGTQAGEVSYRMTANMFNWGNQDNLAKNAEGVEGLKPPLK